MARKKLLESIYPGEILFEEFMKPWALASINSFGILPSHRAESALS
jgi:hypothetical protein